MSRHRHVRNMSTEDYADEMDQEQYGVSPAQYSPSMEQYLYKRPSTTNTNTTTTTANHYDDDDQETDQELVTEIYKQVIQVIPAAVCTKHIIEETIRQFDYDVEKTIQYLLEYTTNQAAKKSNSNTSTTTTTTTTTNSTKKNNTISMSTISAVKSKVNPVPIKNSASPVKSSMMNTGSVSTTNVAAKKTAHTASHQNYDDQEYYDDEDGEYYDDDEQDYDDDDSSYKTKSKSKGKQTNVKTVIKAPSAAVVSSAVGKISIVPSGKKVTNSTTANIPPGFSSTISISSQDKPSPSESFAFDQPSPDDIAFSKVKDKKFTGGAKDSASTPTKITGFAVPSSSSSSSSSQTSSSAASSSLTSSLSRSSSNISSASSSSNLSRSSSALSRQSSTEPAESGDDAAAPRDPSPALSMAFPVAVLPQSAKVESQRKTLLAEAASNDSKVRLNMVVVGHVDAGKSTLMGHLLYLQGHVSDKTMRQYQHESKQVGKSSFAFAWVLDAHESERSRGVTVDVAVQHFETPNRYITLLDAPGHKDFIPNMISGASQADVAVLVVDGSPDGFESGFIDGGQTKEHAVLVRSLGVSELIVAVNKMDVSGWSKDRFDQIINHLQPFLRATGFKDSNVSYIPVSGFQGENLITRKEAALGWYEGPSLIEQIDKFRPPERPVDRALRLCVSDVYKSQMLGVTVGGKIESGSVMAGEKVLLLPMNEVATVKGVSIMGISSKIGRAGENVEVGLTGLSDPNLLSVGQILCSPDRPIPMVQHFEARILTLGIRIPVLAGTQVEVHLQSVDIPGRVSALLSCGKKEVNEKMKPRQVTKNSVAMVEIKTERPVGMELYSDLRSLGRVLLRRDGETVAVGVVTRIIA